MSRLPLRGWLKANAVACERLLNSPSTRKDLKIQPSLMKPIPLVLLAVLVATASLRSQDAPIVVPPDPTTAHIIGNIANGTPSPPAPVPVTPNFAVKSSWTAQVVREEPAPLPGMTPVRKPVNVTVQVVEDPHLPTPPAPALVNSDPAAIARFKAMVAARPKVENIFLSATVYDHQRTMLRWHPNGHPDQEVIAWSALDFNVMSGFSKFTYNGSDYNLFMFVGNDSSEQHRRFAQMRGVTYVPPVFPDLPPSGTPAFVVTQGDSTDADAIAPITALHELYKVEGPQLVAAHQAREQARIEHEAWLRANPPQPQDVLIQVWKREEEAAQMAPLQETTTNTGVTP